MRRELRDKRHPGNCMDPKFFLAQATHSSAQVFQVVQGSSGSSLSRAQVVHVVHGPFISHFFSLPIWFAKLHSSSMACLIFLSSLTAFTGFFLQAKMKSGSYLSRQ